MVGERVIIIFSSRYPCSDKSAFLGREIDALTATFNRVILVPIAWSGDDVRNVACPPRTEVVLGPTQIYNSVIGKIFLLGLGILLFPFTTSNQIGGRALAASVRRCSSIRQIVFALVLLGYDGVSAWFLSRIVPAGSRALLFNYWLFPYCYLTGLVLRKSSRVGRAVARGHGSDIFLEERGNHMSLTRYGYLASLDQVFAAHNAGRDYLVNKIGLDSEKVITLRLGVPDSGRCVDPGSEEGVLSVVSCCHISAFKRVDMVGRVCRRLCRRKEIKSLRWTHIGDGPSFADLKREFDSPDGPMTTDLRGNVPSARVLDEVSFAKPHVFVHLSLWEGLPIAVVEALSLGIPCVATDAGGTREMVDDSVGRLVSLTDEDDEVEDAVFRVWQENCGPDAHALRERCRKRFQERASLSATIPILMSALTSAWAAGQEPSERRN